MIIDLTPEEKPESKYLKNSEDESTKLSAILMIIACIIGAIVTVYYVGVSHGRSEFHNEILKELENKKGAPILLYPPNEVKK